ncbi:MAG: hypothetical protein HY289_15910 [Planctomycetes bacterium]|nr:hypothetical protein [Planctomycetota bacterium]
MCDTSKPNAETPTQQAQPNATPATLKAKWQGASTPVKAGIAGGAAVGGCFLLLLCCALPAGLSWKFFGGVKEEGANVKLKEAGGKDGGPNEKAIKVVDPMKVVLEFNANQVAAEQKWKGKLLVIEGEINQIHAQDLFLYNDDANFRFVAPNVCRFGDEQRAQVAKLKRGDRITATGKFEFVGGGFHLNDCVFALVP